jgi:hypothetical protein
MAYLRPDSHRVNSQLPQWTCALGESPVGGDSVSMRLALYTVGARLHTSSLRGPATS